MVIDYKAIINKLELEKWESIENFTFEAFPENTQALEFKLGKLYNWLSKEKNTNIKPFFPKIL